jgi:ABC-type transport system involved in cytochrome bd biosynthesis fused ATPase/permease subunit
MICESVHILFRCIQYYLREKICVLVTHQIQFLQDATKIIVLDNVCFGLKHFALCIEYIY